MPNALADESSPYLRQHADNPVDWLPWSPQALELARAQNKPILLSIGYSACHWCHVMAHESFEDPATAALMNAHFVNIKVDREERPDIDRIYQTAHHLIARRAGGWPLTMFLSPEDQLPFFGGTYFPNQPRHGMMAFPDLLQRVAELFQQEPEKIRLQGQAVHQALIDIELRENQNQRGVDTAAMALFDAQLLKAYDAEHGGFGRAPKFPQPAILLQALQRAAGKADDDPLREAIIFSLRRIALGGIQDHLGGGFYRYSVDEQWMIPHFEKMLYDNGQMLRLFSEAWRLHPDPLFEDAVTGIIAWLEAEMATPEGAYYAALDADSEGREGLFYLWDPAEVKRLVDSEDYALLAYQFGLDRGANFEGKWHLHGYRTPEAVEAHFGLDRAACAARLKPARQQLLQARNQRPRPGLDDKVITAWNALVIRGLARAAGVFMRPDYFHLARRCLRSLQRECWHEGRLLALSQRSGKTLPAYLDDYALTLQAILECLQFEWDGDDFAFASELARQLIERFEDRNYGGFFFTASDHETLIQRPKSWADEAMPSGNAAAALALHQLGLLGGEPEWVASAEKALQSVADNVNQTPMHAASFVGLLQVQQHPPMQIIVRGDRDSLEPWRSAVLPRLQCGQTAYFIPAGVGGLPEILASKTAATTAAWICEGFSCREPVESLEALLALIDKQNQAPDDRQ